MTESMPTPRKLAEMIVNAQYDSKEPNLDILVDELLAYMKDGYPRKTAQLQIQSAIENIQVKEKKKNKPDKNRQSLLDDAYTYAIKLIQQKGTKEIVNAQLKLFYWFDHKGLTLNDSYEIIHKAKNYFEQAVTKEPELEPTQKVISKKEPEIATSVETQVESQDEIESRLYSFALNFLFTSQDPSKKILSSELINAINDYIEHFSLKYSTVQKLADKAISEFREKSKTTLEFKTAYQELYKTEEKISSKPIQSQDSKAETKKTSKEILGEVIDNALGDFKKPIEQTLENEKKTTEKLAFLVKCPSCEKEQYYIPKKGQKRRRKLCILCKKRFTINQQRILKSYTSLEEIKGSDPSPTPNTVISTGKQSIASSAKKISKNQKSIIPEIIDFIQQIEGDLDEKESLIKLLKKHTSKNAQNDFFSENSTKGVQGVGGPSNGNADQTSRREDAQPNERHSNPNDEIPISNYGHDGKNYGHDKNAHSKNQDNHRTESGSKKDQSSRTRGGMPIDKNGHARDAPDHSRKNSNDPDAPGPDEPNHSNNDNPEKGIYVVHTPLEFVHLQFKDEVGRLHDHRLAMFENLSPRRFGVTQTLADNLRQLMDPPHYNDPAKQHRKKILGEFVFILTKDNKCMLYPKHPFGDLEFFKWIQNHLTKNQMRNLAYYYSRAVSAQKNELATPRIKSLTDEDPANFTIKVNLDNPDQRFFVRRDKSKGDAIEYWGPTRQGFDWVMRYLEPVIEHSISIQTHDKVKELRGRILSQDSYLRNEIPKMQYELEQNGHVLLQLKNKHRVVRALSEHLRDYFDKSLAQGDQRADILADIKQELQDQTVELVKTVRESLGGKLIVINSMFDPRIKLRERILDIIRKNPGLNRKEIHQHFKIKRGCVNGIVRRDLLNKKLVREDKHRRLFIIG